MTVVLVKYENFSDYYCICRETNMTSITSGKGGFGGRKIGIVHGWALKQITINVCWFEMIVSS